MILKCITLIFLISTFLSICESSESAVFKTNDILAIKQDKIILEQVKWRNEQEQQTNTAYKSMAYSDCSEVTINHMPSGIYEIQVPYSYRFKVACDTKTWGGHWTIILQRMDGSVNFYRNWETYVDGFGDLDGEFFLGLDKIYELTKESSQQLLVLLEDSEGNESYETYEKFAISSRREDYALNTLGKANGTAGDSLSHHFISKFSTYDRNNSGQKANCAEEFTGAWWYGNQCHYSNLAGKYGDNTFGKGVNWYTFRGFRNSLKRAVMMIRPRK